MIFKCDTGTHLFSHIYSGDISRLLELTTFNGLKNIFINYHCILKIEEVQFGVKNYAFIKPMFTVHLLYSRCFTVSGEFHC